jgi:hypothetical protein
LSADKIGKHSTCTRKLLTIFLKSGDPLTMGYFDNLDNEPLNKYEKNLKNKKK